MTLKWMDLMPTVESSAPSLLAGRSSARRKAVWSLKMESSLMVTSTATVASTSNWVFLLG
jgi:hypothetical protein